MSSNVIFFAWNRPIPGREGSSAELFQEFVQYAGGLQQAGTIESFDIVLLNPHGGDMNGFFVFRGESGKLDALMSSDEWVTFMVRGGIQLQGSGAIRGVTGDLVMERMGLWTSNLPS